jgi:hypothetical protein
MCDSSSTRPPRPRCVIDGEADPRVLEFHYIGDARIVLCRNCYGKLLDAPRERKAIWDPPDELEIIAHALLGEADFLAMLACSRRKFAQLLIDRVRREAPSDGEDRA